MNVPRVAEVPAVVRARGQPEDGEGQDGCNSFERWYLDLLFEDLALPNPKQNQQRQLTEYKTHQAGYTANGVPASRISVVRSF